MNAPNTSSFIEWRRRRRGRASTAPRGPSGGDGARFAGECSGVAWSDTDPERAGGGGGGDAGRDTGRDGLREALRDGF